MRRMFARVSTRYKKITSRDKAVRWSNAKNASNDWALPPWRELNNAGMAKDNSGTRHACAKAALNKDLRSCFFVKKDPTNMNLGPLSHFLCQRQVAQESRRIMQIREPDFAISLPTSPTPPPGWFKGTPSQHNELNGPECTRGGGEKKKHCLSFLSFFFFLRTFLRQRARRSAV